jgi:hypothetical protein
MSDSSLPQSDDEPRQETVDGWLAAVHERLDERRSMCEQIARHAQNVGLDCDWILVNKHYQYFCSWYYGGLATGYLIGRTGVKYKKHNIEHWSK